MPLYEGLAYLPVRVLLQLSLRGDSPRALVVGQAGVRTDEDTILNRHAVINGCAILYLDPVSDHHVQVDVDTFANDARLANLGPLSDLCLVPYPRPLADPGQGRNLGCGVNLHLRC